MKKALASVRLSDAENCTRRSPSSDSTSRLWAPSDLASSSRQLTSLFHVLAFASIMMTKESLADTCAAVVCSAIDNWFSFWVAPVLVWAFDDKDHHALSYECEGEPSSNGCRYILPLLLQEYIRANNIRHSLTQALIVKVALVAITCF